MPDGGARARLLAARQGAAAQAIATESVFHQARVLLLIDAFSGRSRGMRGMARMARLDYLLRFPMVLDYMDLDGVSGWPAGAATLQAERHATDVAFAGSRYGLWTDRYVLITGALIGKQLVTLVPGNIVEPVATRTGQSAAHQLAQADEWARTRLRAEYLRSRLNVSAARLDQLLRPAIGRMETDLLKARP